MGEKKREIPSKRKTKTKFVRGNARPSHVRHSFILSHDSFCRAVCWVTELSRSNAQRCTLSVFVTVRLNEERGERTRDERIPSLFQSEEGGQTDTGSLFVTPREVLTPTLSLTLSLSLSLPSPPQERILQRIIPVSQTTTTNVVAYSSQSWRKRTSSAPLVLVLSTTRKSSPRGLLSMTN